MRYIFTLLFIINGLSIISAQETTDEVSYQYIIKYTPTATFNIITPGLQFGLEQRLDESRSMQYEVGILSSRLGVTYTEGNMFGYRLRAEYRKYSNAFDKKNKFNGVILEGKQRFLEDKFMLSYPDLENAYSERLNLIKLTSSASIYYTRGTQRVYNKFSIEIAAGIGFRYLYNSIPSVPDGVIKENLENLSSFYPRIDDNLTLPVGFLCLRIGYLL